MILRRLTHALAAGLVLSTPALTQEAPAFPEIAFRRVTVPSADDTGPRITVQIQPGDNFMAPDPNAPPPEESVAAAPSQPSSNQADWFWSTVPSAVSAPGNRFAMALTHLDTAPEAASLPIASLEQLGRIAEAHGREILAATVGTDISPALVLAVIAVESAGRVDAESGAGAQGLMQLIPDTASRFGVEDSLNPAENIRGGTEYLSWLTDRFGRDTILALAGYNAGEGAVSEHGGVPPYAETRNYVPRVLATWALARQLCLTPPELPSDGCVFVTMTGG